MSAITDVRPSGLVSSAGPKSAAGSLAPGLPLAYRQLVLSRAPIAYLRLAEASGLVAADETGHGFTGTISATGITYGQSSGVVSDPAARAFLFNGSTGKVDLAYNAALNAPLFSIGGWFKGGPNGNCPMWECRPASSGATAAGFDLFIGTSGANPAIGLSICSANVTQTIISLAMSLNVWHYVVGTYDGTQARLYVDGALRAGPTTCPFTPNASRTTGIGHINAGGNFLAGAAAELEYENYVLSLANIQRAWYAAVGAELALSASTRAAISGISTGVLGS